MKKPKKKLENENAKKVEVIDKDKDEFFAQERFDAYQKKVSDFTNMQEYLAAFPFKWDVLEVHNEPLGPWGIGGLPQVRITGKLRGEGVIAGKFEVTFAGRRIEVILPPERQAIFENAMRKLLPEK